MTGPCLAELPAAPFHVENAPFRPCVYIARVEFIASGSSALFCPSDKPACPYSRRGVDNKGGEGEGGRESAELSGRDATRRSDPGIANLISRSI